MPAASDARAGRRRTALALSWLSYATYYLGRKAFSAIKKPLQHELGLAPAALGAIDTAFLSAYALGQFASGVVADRIGARRLVGAGMLISAVACAAFGASSSAFAFGACFVLNGLAQSTGWPGTTRVVAEWTTPENRGTVMGLWSTCYQLGGLVATMLAGFLAARYGWRSALFVPAVVLALVGVLVLIALPAGPVPAPVPQSGPAADATLHAGTAETEGAALAPAAAPMSAEDAELARAGSLMTAQLGVLKSRTLWLFGASYFFIKLVRYALLFWLPYYLATVEGYSTEKAANVSIAFDAGGIVGVVLLGRLADRTRGLSRPALCALSVVLLVPVLGIYSRLALGNALLDVLLLALLGALLFGPDSLLSGAATQDAGGPGAAATAVGFVNGVGSFGALLQGLIVPPIAAHFGWSALFPALALFALGAAIALVPTLGAVRPVAVK